MNARGVPTWLGLGLAALACVPVWWGLHAVEMADYPAAMLALAMAWVLGRTGVELVALDAGRLPRETARGGLGRSSGAAAPGDRGTGDDLVATTRG